MRERRTGMLARPVYKRLLLVAGLAWWLATSAVPAEAAPHGGLTGAPRTYPVTIDRGVRYGTDGSTPLIADVYRPPATASPRWPVIVVHGGGWVGGSPRQVAPEARALAAVGFVVFAISYRLATPSAPGYPGQITDVEKAVTWVESHGSRYGVRGTRVALIGGSAGAYLADMVGVQHPHQVAAVASFSGPTDLVALRSDLEGEYQGKCGLACLQARGENIETFLGCLHRSCSQSLLKQASPSTYASKSSPPFFIVNSTRELVPLQQATRFANQLRSLHVAVTLTIEPGSVHGFSNASRVRRPLYQFLISNLRVANRPSHFPYKILAAAVAAFVVFLAIVALAVRAWRRRTRIL
jgi:acetyl esterase